MITATEMIIELVRSGVPIEKISLVNQLSEAQRDELMRRLAKI